MFGRGSRIELATAVTFETVAINSGNSNFDRRNGLDIFYFSPDIRLIWSNNPHGNNESNRLSLPAIEGPAETKSLSDAACILWGYTKGVTLVYPGEPGYLGDIQGVHLRIQRAIPFTAPAEVLLKEVRRAQKIAWDRSIAMKTSQARIG